MPFSKQNEKEQVPKLIEDLKLKDISSFRSTPDVYAHELLMQAIKSIAPAAQTNPSEMSVNFARQIDLLEIICKASHIIDEEDYTQKLAKFRQENQTTNETTKTYEIAKFKMELLASYLFETGMKEITLQIG